MSRYIEYICKYCGARFTDEDTQYLHVIKHLPKEMREKLEAGQE